MSDAVSILATQLSGQLATPSAWLVGTVYTTGQAVSRSGSNYYAISGSTGVDPATDGGVHWGLLSGVGPQPATLTALGSAIVSGARTVVAARLANRVSLLTPMLNPLALPCTKGGSALNGMSAASFLAGAVKGRAAGAQEARAVSAELPEKLLPAKAKLDKVLADYVKAGEDLEDSRGHLARAESDEAAALDSSGDDAEDKIAVAIRSKAIYTARVTNREAAQAKLLKELKSALDAGHNEFSALLGDLLAKWREILAGRVMEAGQLGKDVLTEIEILLENAKPISELRGLEIPSASITYCDSTEQIVGMARSVLAGYEAIAALGRKQI